MKSNQDPNQKRSQNGQAAEDAILHELLQQPAMVHVSTTHRNVGEVACTVINPAALREQKLTLPMLEQHCLIETPGQEDFLASRRNRWPVLRKLVPLVAAALAVGPGGPLTA